MGFLDFFKSKISPAEHDPHHSKKGSSKNSLKEKVVEDAPIEEKTNQAGSKEIKPEQTKEIKPEQKLSTPVQKEQVVPRRSAPDIPKEDIDHATQQVLQNQGTVQDTPTILETTPSDQVQKNMEIEIEKHAHDQDHIVDEEIAVAGNDGLGHSNSSGRMSPPPVEAKEIEPARITSPPARPTTRPVTNAQRRRSDTAAPAKKSVPPRPPAPKRSGSTPHAMMNWELKYVNNNAEKVFMASDLDGWKARHQLEKRENGEFVLHLPCKIGTKIHYKFIVDGDWLCDDNARKEYDDSHNENNFAVVKPKLAE